MNKKLQRARAHCRERAPACEMHVMGAVGKCLAPGGIVMIYFDQVPFMRRRNTSLPCHSCKMRHTAVQLGAHWSWRPAKLRQISYTNAGILQSQIVTPLSSAIPESTQNSVSFLHLLALLSPCRLCNAELPTQSKGSKSLDSGAKERVVNPVACL
jgi:hypothetical protein